MAYCSACKDEFEPIESRESFLDDSQPVFCCAECADHYWAELEASEDYDLGYGPRTREPRLKELREMEFEELVRGITA